MKSFVMACVLVNLPGCVWPVLAADADLILHGGRVVSVDSAFSVAEAMAVKDGRITVVGRSRDVLARERGRGTRIIDLRGKSVLPGLIDAHVHALGAGLSEARGKLPPLDSIAAIQEYIREQALTTPRGEWIVVPRTLPPRLKEMRMPTRHDLDVTPDHPVAFDGSYVWSANSKALAVSGINRGTKNPPGGEVVKGPDGEPNGILRNAAQLLKGVQTSAAFSESGKLDALAGMLRMYAAAGLTGVGDRAVTTEDAALYEKLKSSGKLPIRVVMTWRPDGSLPVEELERTIRETSWKTDLGDEWLKFGTFKITLDGGQSVGTAYQRMPYGAFARQLYGQTNPDSRGTLFVDAEKLYRIFAAAQARGWQLTAHSQGGAAIDTLLDVFERLDRVQPIASMRHHVMHGSFMSEDAIARMKRMGVAADVQPGWLYFDVPALQRVFGYSSMRYFFPVRSLLQNGIRVAGGSDHMIGHDRNTAVNPYNPFFNMWACIVRKTRDGSDFYPNERISREQALKMFTIDAAWLQFSEKQRGSLEPGKLADFVVIEQDFLKCPENAIRTIEPLMTFVGGRIAYEKQKAPE